MPNRTPHIGVLGIMQELYDDMLPGITERQGRYLADVAASLEGVADAWSSHPPAIATTSSASCASTSTSASTAS